MNTKCVTAQANIVTTSLFKVSKIHIKEISGCNVNITITDYFKQLLFIFQQYRTKIIEFLFIQNPSQYDL